MANTKDINLENYKLKLLVCGASGSGKTHFAGTFPRPFFFDFDGGMLTLKGKDIDYETIHSYEHFKKLADKIENDDKYETIVLDSLTRLSDLLMDRIQELNHSSDKPPTIPEYGIFFANMRRLIEQFLLLDKNVIFTAHEELIKDEVTGSVEAVPLIATKIRFRLSNYFDEAVYLSVTKKKGVPIYTLSTVGDRKRGYVKSRLGILPPVIEDPSYDKLLVYMTNSKIENTKRGGENK